MSKVTEIQADQFETEVVQYEGAVLVDFFADWCGPCKMIAPLLVNLSAEREDLKIVKVNADNASELLAKYGVRGLPTLLMFNQGSVAGTKVGAISLTQLREFADQF